MPDSWGNRWSFINPEKQQGWKPSESPSSRNYRRALGPLSMRAAVEGSGSWDRWPGSSGGRGARTGPPTPPPDNGTATHPAAASGWLSLLSRRLRRAASRN
ncbi:hypothetical protein AAFF_G00222520 [Aldrovandia affinis]|uniref:Uncharacterized protein n=1 Tax=Aldrovandia affinis TaxID=143900 RepID=A0AAD7RFH5_9TELE|nr:hypothetical protein AAFF_G00222520 [Aldrovandia affinis]